VTRRLFGFLPTDGDASARLIRLTTGGSEDVDRPRENDEIVIFVPGSDVSIFHRPLPTKGDRLSRQAAPFAIEDDVASSVSDLHIALGPEPSDLTTPRELQVVRLSAMQLWLESLREHGLAGAQLVAEQSLFDEGELLDLGPRVVGALAAGPFAFDTNLPRDILTALIDGESVSDVSSGDPLTILAQRFEERSSAVVDLRQGRFGQNSGFSFSEWREWRMAASLVAVCGIAWLATGYAGIASTRAAADDIRTGISTSYQQAFPDAGVPVDPVRAISRALGDAGAGPALDFLDTSAVLYAALSEVPNSSLRAVRYDPRRGGYVASIAYAGYGDDAALQSALESRGYTAILGDARRGGDVVFGDVTLTTGGGR